MRSNMAVKIYVCLFSLIVVVGVIGIAIGETKNMPNCGGYFVLRSGKTINFIKVNEPDMTLSFTYGPEDKSTRIPMASVKEIIFGGSRSGRIVLRDGRTIDGHEIDTSPWDVDGGGGMSYSYFDDVALKESSDACYFNKVACLVFDDNVGHFRRCPHCEGVWPDSYLFCPNDGVRTVWGEPSGSLGQIQKFSDEERAERRAYVMEAILNARLSRAGIDPASEQAQRSRDFCKLWMNPAADLQEIHKKLDSIREDFCRKSKRE